MFSEKIKSICSIKKVDFFTLGRRKGTLFEGETKKRLLGPTKLKAYFFGLVLYICNIYIYIIYIIYTLYIHIIYTYFIHIYTYHRRSMSWLQRHGPRHREGGREASSTKASLGHARGPPRGRPRGEAAVVCVSVSNMYHIYICTYTYDMIYIYIYI